MSFIDSANSVKNSLRNLTNSLEDFVASLDNIDMGEEEFDKLASVRKSLDYEVRRLSEIKEELEEKFQAILQKSEDQNAGTRRRRRRTVKRGRTVKRRN